MRHSFLTRLFSALLALCFATGVAEPLRMHACPVHGMGAAAATGVGHGHSAAHDDAAPAEHSTHKHLCQCVGTCCATALVAVLPPPQVASREVDVTAPGLPDHAYIPVARSLLLPFANGPPRA